jgi:hypothetical protein
MKVNVVKEGSKYGLIGGLLFLLINYGTWGLGSTATFVSVIGISSFIPYMIAILIITGFSLRKANNNVLTFQDALKFAFVAYIIISLTEAVGNYVLYNFLDHNLTAKVFEISKEKALKLMQKFGASDQQVDDAMKKMDADTKETTFKNVILGLGLALVWGFCKSMLVALIIRKEEKFAEE